MPVIKNRLRTAGQRTQYVKVSQRSGGTPHSRSRLDSSVRLIAPAHGLTLPILEGINERFAFSFGSDAALPLARTLIKRGLLRERHMDAAASAVSSLEAALGDFVASNFGYSRDEFDIRVRIADCLEEYRKPQDVLFFIWDHSNEPQYIPLRPVFEKLEGNPDREALMGSLYHWLYCSAARVFDVFGLREAENVYHWRKECYTEARENGEDVDLEGEVEAADPAKVISYIRNAEQLVLTGEKAAAAMESISDNKLRLAFEVAHRLYKVSRKIKLPVMAEKCRRILDDAAYYMDAYPIPGIGISHWRDDPIVAWFDEFCQEQFESGTTPGAPIILCFRPDDAKFFGQIMDTLPALLRTVAGLSEWTRFAQELENASDYGNRKQA